MMIDVVTSQALLSDVQNTCYGGIKDKTAKRRYSDYEKMVLEQRFEIMTQNYNSLKLRVENLEDQAVIDTSKYIGGSGGSTFDDRSVKNGKPITAIRLRCGTFFDSIQARYGSSWGPVHGANYIPNICINNGVDFEYQFNSTEYITQIHGSYGAHVDSITISTNIRVLPRCGGSGGTSQKTVSGTRLMYLKGRRGCYVDT
ncbi:hypothetical protein FSP39_001474 [Pinctada imbricata]|uniref:Jacalin-type lectin domain-containing protein n=1 Tax=Pinctada imbricata TaxID=66713 RepID=A0AA88XGV1_PINIB|nr:hypothetical protein FSP39_001474 [Pinctada imbricata]